MDTLLSKNDGRVRDFFWASATLDESAQWRGRLSPVEAEKAEMIKNPTLQSRFVVSRGLRRQLLADCTGRTSAELEFHEDGKSKPRLLEADGWDFNLSHSGNRVALVARRGPVGVDLEMQRQVPQMAGIVGRYFHRDEAVAWKKLGAAQRPEAFFALWSAREAAMKCLGFGLAEGLSLTRVDPSLIFGQSVAPGRVGETTVALHRLEAPKGYLLFVAVAKTKV